MNLILTDFDGTLTKKDSFLEFVGHNQGRHQMIFGLMRLAIPIAAMKMGYVYQQHSKEMFLSMFYKGLSKEYMYKLGEDFCREKLPDIIRESLLKQLLAFEEKGDKIVVVSASMDFWLQPYCKKMNWDLICTKSDFTNGIFSGKFASPNCNGREKAKRIKEDYDLTKFNKIIAYGNSKGDQAMFDLADEFYWI